MQASLWLIACNTWEIDEQLSEGFVDFKKLLTFKNVKF